MGPAPPKAISVKSRGSWPRWIEISRMAEVMRATAMRTTPSASASTVRLTPMRVGQIGDGLRARAPRRS